MITDINQLDLSKTYTYADYLTWQFDGMVELIKGKIFNMSPAPGSYHQRVSGNIFKDFAVFLNKKPCKVFIAPFDVRLSMFRNDQEILTVVQPDICVICDLSKIDEKGCNGTPDLMIEILSPSTKKKDVQDKFQLYEESGVQEYWIVYPLEKLVDVFLLEDNKYRLVKKYV
ncbi:MAG: Uma2 family endonuclease, partial [Opitutaceae bacterium]|nr:Uma2 family endonuclease [Cytophagales bacterium]